MKLLTFLGAVAAAIALPLAAHAQDPPPAPAPAPQPPPAGAPAAPVFLPPSSPPGAPAGGAAQPLTGDELLKTPPVTSSPPPGAAAQPPPPGIPAGLPPPPAADWRPTEAFSEAELAARREVDELVKARAGFHPGISVGFTSVLLNAITEGATASFLANWGVGRYVDLRAAVRLSAGVGGSSGQTSWGPDGLIEFPLTLRFNFGTVYSMAVGMTGGVMFLSVSDCTLYTGNNFNGTSCGRTVQKWPAFGPEVSFTSFRVGPKRQVEIEVLGGMLGMPWSLNNGQGTEVYPRVSISTSYLFL